MKIKALIFFLMLFAACEPVKAEDVSLSTAAAGPAAGLTLKHCYELSLFNSPSAAAKKEAIEETKGRYRQAVGAVLPHVSFSVLRFRQSVDSSVVLPGYLGSQDSDQDKFTLTQPLFSGFREFAAISAQKAEKRQRIYEELRFRQTLVADVSDAFFNLIEARENIKIYEDIKGIITSRLDDLKERESVGRSRKSDVSNTMVLYYQNEAQLEAAKNNESLFAKQLKYLTGVEIGPLSDWDVPEDVSRDEEAFTGRINERPDIIAARESALITRKQVSMAKANYWPSINLNGDYFTRDTGKFTGVNWDAFITAELPLLPVVQTAGSVKEASGKAREADLNLELAKRNALLEARTAHEYFLSVAANKAAYQNALNSARENYTLQEEDYKYNLLSNLDLLQAIQFLQGARRDYVHSLYETKRAYWRLMAAAGETFEIKN